MVLRVRRRKPLVLVAVAALITLQGCWGLQPSKDGAASEGLPHAADRSVT